MTCERGPLPDQGVYYEIHACASCGRFIDGDEIKVRTGSGWLPYHPVCAPDQRRFQHHGFCLSRGGCLKIKLNGQ